MKHITNLIGIVSLIFSIVLVNAQSADQKGLEIAKKANEVDEGWGNNSNTLTMTLKNRHGQETSREMHGFNLEMAEDGDKSMIVFDSPRDVKGTATLTYSHKVGTDDQWLYLPALKRVKRISSTNKSGPFMGSEFAYEDLSSQEVEKYTYKYLKEEKLNGIDTYVLERYPVDKNSGYKKHIVWYNKSNYRIEKTEFYDRKGELLKTLTFTDYNQYLDKFWRAGEMLMVNHQNGKQTHLKFSDYKFKTEISEDDFTQNSLKRAK